MERITDEQLWSWVDREAPELEVHLDRHPEDRTRVEALKSRLGLFFPLPEGPRLPSHIGPYEILRVIGEGGMSVVYEARQPNPVRIVALKVLRGGPASERAEQLFRREAEALARLSHPGIATIHEAGRTGDGRHWLAMELVRGRPLDVDTVEKETGTRPTVETFLQVCDAVEHVHQHGVIHRDLKPSNILVDETGRVRVLDFGLARLRDRAGAAGEPRTEPGDLLGTLPYMSPEQARGATDLVGERSDVYSLGVILYRLLSGEAPYRTDPADLPASLHAICHAPPSPLRREGRRLDRDLETVVLQAFEKEPARRYAGPGDLARDLRRWLACEPILARRAGPVRRIVLAARRWPAAAAAAGILAALAAGLPFLLPPGETPSEPKDFLAPTLPDGYPKLSPFEKVRWKEATPLVTVDGREWVLLAVNGIAADLLVTYTRQTKGAQFWTKRFEEDFVQVLTRIRDGRDPGSSVDLTVRDPADSVETELRGVPMTAQNRWALWEASQRAPWAAVRWKADQPHVEIEGRWWRPLSVDGIPVDRIIDYCRSVRGGRGRSSFSHRILRALQDLGAGGGDTVTVDVEDPATGARVTLSQVPLTVGNFEAIEKELLREGS